MAPTSRDRTDRADGPDSSYPKRIGNVSLVMNEAEKNGTPLDPVLLESLNSAIEFSKSGNHEAAVAK
jgi:hypothetical protein